MIYAFEKYSAKLVLRSANASIKKRSVRLLQQLLNLLRELCKIDIRKMIIHMEDIFDEQLSDDCCCLFLDLLVLVPDLQTVSANNKPFINSSTFN